MQTKQTMHKTILVTGSTDGIGLETARMLVQLGHNVILHGRHPVKLDEVARTLSALSHDGRIESYVADLSRMAAVEELAKAVAEKHANIDVLINNAGVFSTPDPITLERIKKGLTPEQAEKGMAKAKAAGIDWRFRCI